MEFKKPSNCSYDNTIDNICEHVLNPTLARIVACGDVSAMYCPCRIKIKEDIPTIIVTERKISLPKKEPGSRHDGINIKPQVDKSEHKHDEAYKKCGEIQPMDVIAAMGDLETFCRTNAIKYVMRYQFKGQEISDIDKLKVYVDHLVKIVHERNSK